MPAILERDGLLNHGRDASGPARRAVAVTPSDTVDLTTYAKALYVGVAGNVRVLTVGGEDPDAVTFVNHPVGWLIVPDFCVLEGPFLVAALEYAGEHEGEATFALSLASAGAIGFSAI